MELQNLGNAGAAGVTVKVDLRKLASAGIGFTRPDGCERAGRAQYTCAVGDIPAGPSDPSIEDPTRPRPMRTASAIGVDATRPFGKPFSEVADVPGWEDFEVTELEGPR